MYSILKQLFNNLQTILLCDCMLCIFVLRIKTYILERMHCLWVFGVLACESLEVTDAVWMRNS